MWAHCVSLVDWQSGSDDTSEMVAEHGHAPVRATVSD
jgi:hypothetical protein